MCADKLIRPEEVQDFYERAKGKLIMSGLRGFQLGLASLIVPAQLKSVSLLQQFELFGPHHQGHYPYS